MNKKSTIFAGLCLSVALCLAPLLAWAAFAYLEVEAADILYSGARILRLNTAASSAELRGVSGAVVVYTDGSINPGVAVTTTTLLTTAPKAAGAIVSPVDIAGKAVGLCISTGTGYGAWVTSHATTTFCGAGL
jgi:hypothetical protein